MTVAEFKTLETALHQTAEEMSGLLSKALWCAKKIREIKKEMKAGGDAKDKV